MSQKLTKTVVEGAKVEAKRYILWDRELKGFGLLVLPSGVKSYLYNYRTPEGARRRITIGKHGDWTAAEAREKAEDYRDAVKHGLDPLGQQQSARQTATLSEVLDDYLASDAYKAKAESTRKIDQGRINRHLKPLLGKVYITKLAKADVAKALDDIRQGKTATKVKTKARGLARVTGGETTARDTIALLRAILNWAIDQERYGITSNPADAVKLPPRRKRRTILEGPEDYKRLHQTLYEMVERREVREPVADAIWLIAMTGARLSEISKLRWRHIQGTQIVLPPDEHKAGRATNEDRVIPLVDEALALVEKQGRGEPDDWVFRPAKGKGPIELKAVWRKVRERAGLPEGIGLHGLRHSYLSHLAMSGAQAAELMAAGGHNQLSTVTGYIHWAELQRARLAERGAAPMLAAMRTKPKIQKKRITRKSL